MPEYVIAVHAFPALEEGELLLEHGKRYRVLQKDEEYGDGWWEGCDDYGNVGLFPAVYTAPDGRDESASPAPRSTGTGDEPSLNTTLVQDIDETIDQYASSQDEYATSQHESTTTANDMDESDLDSHGPAAGAAPMSSLSSSPSPPQGGGDGDDHDNGDEATAVLLWTPEEVAAYLEREGLGSVAHSFIEHEVSGDIFLELDLTTLKELDIFSFGKRFEVMRRVEYLRSLVHSTRHSSSTTNSSSRLTSPAGQRANSRRGGPPVSSALAKDMSRLAISTSTGESSGRGPAGKAVTTPRLHTGAFGPASLRSPNVIDSPAAQEDRKTRRSHSPDSQKHWRKSSFDPDWRISAQGTPRADMTSSGSSRKHRSMLLKHDSLESSKQPTTTSSDSGFGDAPSFIGAGPDAGSSSGGGDASRAHTTPGLTQPQRSVSTSSISAYTREPSAGALVRGNEYARPLPQTPKDDGAPRSHARMQSQDTLRATRSSHSRHASALSRGSMGSSPAATAAVAAAATATGSIHRKKASSIGDEVMTVREMPPGEEGGSHVAFQRRSVSSPSKTTTTTATPSPATGPEEEADARREKSRRVTTKKSVLGRARVVPTGIAEGIQNTSAQEAKQGADHAGWLRKKSDKYSVWKNRYFVLKGTRLAYYYAETDAREKGLIDITSHRITIMDSILYGSRWVIKIMPPAPGAARGVMFTPPKVHYFACETRQSLREWHSAFIKASIGRDLSVPVMSTSRVPTVSLAKAREMRAQEPASMAEADASAADNVRAASGTSIPTSPAGRDEAGPSSPSLVHGAASSSALLKNTPNVNLERRNDDVQDEGMRSPGRKFGLSPGQLPRLLSGMNKGIIREARNAMGEGASAGSSPRSPPPG